MAGRWTWLLQLAGGTVMEKVMRETTRVCDRLAPRNVALAKQREIAALAYKLWLARGFQKMDRHKKTVAAPNPDQQCEQRSRA